MRIEITSNGLEAILGKLAKVNTKHIVRPALEAIAVQYAGYMREYPSRSSPSRRSVYGQPFKSAKQRRKVMAMIRNGEIPYTRGTSARSERLGQKWTHEMRSDTEAVIGNSASYAPLVQGVGMQSLYMKAVGWKTTEQVAQDKQAELIAGFNKAAAAAMDEVLG